MAVPPFFPFTINNLWIIAAFPFRDRAQNDSQNENATLRWRAGY
jgi:hypothetical protein